MSGKKISIIVLAICFVVLVVGVAFKYTSPKSSPELSFNNAWEGLRQNSITKVESSVDIQALSTNIIDQLFKQPAKQEAGMLEQLEGWAERKYASFIRPEMVKSLGNQMVRFISLGSFGKTEKDAILSKLKNEILGDNGYFKPAINFSVKGMEATADLPIIRSDINAEFSLKLMFAKKDESWFLVSIPNLNLVLEDLEKLRLRKIQLQNDEIQAEFQKTIKVISMHKSSGITKWGVGNAVIIQGSFENISNKDIKFFDAKVDVINSTTSETLKTVSISDSDILKTGGISEKSWPMIVNPLQENDTLIYELPSQGIALKVRFSKIVFADGSVIELLKDK